MVSGSGKIDLQIGSRGLEDTHEFEEDTVEDTAVGSKYWTEELQLKDFQDLLHYMNHPDRCMDTLR